MTKKIIILAVLLLNLVSCYKEVKKDYKNLVPYIEVEKTKEEVFKNITIKDYINKLESKQSFVCFFYSLSCPYCEKLINNLINPYVSKTNNTIYGIDIYDEENYCQLNKIEYYQPNGNDYFFNENNAISITRPITQIIEKGIIIEYEKGYSLLVIDMIKAYIK